MKIKRLEIYKIKSKVMLYEADEGQIQTIWLEEMIEEDM